MKLIGLSCDYILILNLLDDRWRNGSLGPSSCSGVRVLTGTGSFSLHHHVQTGSGVHPASHLIGTRVSFPGVKRQVREANHSLPTSAEIKNAWSYTSTPPIHLLGIVLS